MKLAAYIRYTYSPRSPRQWQFRKFRAGGFSVLFLLGALFFFCGCAGSKLPGENAGTSDAALKSADSSFIKKEFLDGYFTPALESKNPEKIKELFECHLIKKSHWKNFIDTVCLLNNPKFEAGGLHSNLKTAGDGFIVSEVSFNYKLYGFTGLDYNLFVKEGRLVFDLKTFYGNEKNPFLIISDGFDGTYHIKGRLITEDNDALAGAAITLSSDKHDFSCTSGENGEFRLEYIPEAEFTLTVENPGYSLFSKKISCLKKGEYLLAGEITINKLASASYCPAAENEKKINLTPGRFSKANRLGAAAADKSVSLEWPDLKLNTGKKYTYKIYRKSPGVENFKLISMIDDSAFFTDEGLNNAAIYVYKVEVYEKDRDADSPAVMNFGPVAAMPASYKLTIEFEDLLSGPLKWNGVRPLIVSEKSFSNGRYITFDPFKTTALSLLTPEKIKTGYYKVFLYVKRTVDDSALKIEIKQFGELEDERAFYRGEISLKSPASRECRDVIELAEMLIAPESWKNEALPEDYCEIAIKISQSEKSPAAETDGKNSTGQENKIALDVIEFVKID